MKDKSRLRLCSNMISNYYTSQTLLYHEPSSLTKGCSLAFFFFLRFGLSLEDCETASASCCNFISFSQPSSTLSTEDLPPWDCWFIEVPYRLFNELFYYWEKLSKLWASTSSSLFEAWRLLVILLLSGSSSSSITSAVCLLSASSRILSFAISSF